MSKEKEIKAATYVWIGAGTMFLLCLLIGLADKWGVLDPVLDYLNIK